MGVPQLPESNITRRKLMFTVGLGVPVVALAATGCAGRESGQDSSAGSDKVLKLTTGFSIKNLIPSKTGFWGNEFGYADLLLRPQPDGKPTAWLLESATAESDLDWVLTLKQGIRFQNGNSLDASGLAELINWHVANTESVKGVLAGMIATAEGDLKIRLTTQSPVPQMANILADEACFTVFDLPTYQATGDDPQKLLEGRIYTGPYVPTSLTDEKLVMEADPEHWAGTPGLAGVEVLFVSDAAARIQAVQSGEADIALYPPTQAVGTLKGNQKASFNTGEPDGPSFCIYLNQHKPVFATPEVRKAVLRMIDYRALAEDVMQGVYEPVSSFYNPAMTYAIDIWKTDLVEAESLLASVGANKKDGKWMLADGTPIAFEILTYPQQPDSDALALAIQSQLGAQGVDVSIRQVSDISAEMETDNWDCGLSSNGTVSFGGSPIPPLLRYYHSTGNRNWSHINDPELDALIDQLAVTMDESTTNDLLVRIQRIIGERGLNGFCGRRRPAVVVGSRMKDYQPAHALLWVDSGTTLQG